MFGKKQVRNMDSDFLLIERCQDLGSFPWFEANLRCQIKSLLDERDQIKSELNVLPIEHDDLLKAIHKLKQEKKELKLKIANLKMQQDFIFRLIQNERCKFPRESYYRGRSETLQESLEPYLDDVFEIFHRNFLYLRSEWLPLHAKEHPTQIDIDYIIEDVWAYLLKGLIMSRKFYKLLK